MAKKKLKRRKPEKYPFKGRLGGKYVTARAPKELEALEKIQFVFRRRVLNRYNLLRRYYDIYMNKQDVEDAVADGLAEYLALKHSGKNLQVCRSSAALLVNRLVDHHILRGTHLSHNSREIWKDTMVHHAWPELYPQVDEGLDRLLQSLLKTKRFKKVIDTKLADEVDYAEYLQGLREVIQTVLQRLSVKERTMLSLWYGLDGQEPLTLKEIGKIFRISQEGARRYIRNAHFRLEKPFLKRAFEEYVEDK